MSGNKLQVVSDAGGMGDQIWRLAAAREILTLAPDMEQITFYGPDYLQDLIDRAEDLKPFVESTRFSFKTFDDLRAQGADPNIAGVQFSKRTHSPGRLIVSFVSRSTT